MELIKALKRGIKIERKTQKIKIRRVNQSKRKTVEKQRKIIGKIKVKRRERKK